MPENETTGPQTSASRRLESSHRIPLVATAVFVVTMLAIWLMGRSLAEQYVPDPAYDKTELTRDGSG